MTVWRIQLKPDVYKDKMKELYAFCKKNELIGVGWIQAKDARTKEDIETQLNSSSYEEKDKKAGKQAITAMSEMKINDLIWTRFDNGIYYLCRVIGLWKDRQLLDDCDTYDIPNYVNVEWLEIGPLPYSPIPGKVISSLSRPRTVQKVKYVDNISMYIWDKFSKVKQYTEALSNQLNTDIWNLLPAEAIEELVILYLQIKNGFHVYSSSVKTNTPTFECVMVDSKSKDKHHVYPQVKSGGVSLDANADEYQNLLKKEPNAEVYLFAVSQVYSNKDCNEQVKCIDINDLNNFMKEYYDYLPDLTKYWIEIYKEINHLK